MLGYFGPSKKREMPSERPAPGEGGRIFGCFVDESGAVPVGNAGRQSKYPQTVQKVDPS